MKRVGVVPLFLFALLTIHYKHWWAWCITQSFTNGVTMKMAGLFWQYCAVAFVFGRVPLRVHSYWDCHKISLKSCSFVWLLSTWNIFILRNEGIFLPPFIVRHPATCSDRTRRDKWNHFNIISVYEKPQKKENIFWKILHMYILHCIVLQTNLHQIHDIF